MVRPMNPYLEQVLAAYYRNVRKPMAIMTALSAVVLGVAVCLLVSGTEFLSPVIALTLFPGAVGVIAGVAWLSLAGNYFLLQALRRDPKALRAVRRSETVFQGDTTGIEYKRVQTLYVELDGGKIVTLYSGRDPEQFTRLESLLKKQIAETATAKAA